MPILDVISGWPMTRVEEAGFFLFKSEIGHSELAKCITNQRLLQPTQSFQNITMLLALFILASVVMPIISFVLESDFSIISWQPPCNKDCSNESLEHGTQEHSKLESLSK